MLRVSGDCEADVVISCFDAEETDSTSIITVEIEKFTGHKPYLGGFRHRKTQQHFHHASTQVREESLRSL